MSRKRAQPRSTRAAQRRAEAARAAGSRSPTSARRPRASGGGLRTLAILGLLALVVALVLGVFAFLGRGGGAAPAATTPSPPASVTPTPSSSPGPTIAVGGPLAEKLVAALHADPFRAHIDETTVARSTAGTVTVTLTAKVVGDVSGKDVALRVSSTGAGPAVDQEVVSLGATTWIRRTGATTWEVHLRTEASSSIDGLLATLRLIDDPAELADMGLQTVDGRSLHHLTAVGSIAYRSSEGAEGAYDHLDVWTTDAGIPVLMKGSFSASQDANAIIGNVTIRYSDVGKPVTITPPSGAPTAIP